MYQYMNSVVAVSPVQPVLGQCRFNNNVYNLRERVGAYNDSCYNCTCQVDTCLLDNVHMH